MSKDKCSNCKSTDSKTFWNFKDDTMLCDKCNKLYGDEWQKEIEPNKKHMSKKQKEKFKEIIEEGKWNFVFTYGIFRFGMLSALFMILFDKFILDEKIDSFDVTLSIICFGIAGLVWGLWMWSYMNKKLREK